MRINAPTGGVRKFCADKYGVVLPALVKGKKGPSFKEVKALCVAAGATEAQLKADSKQWDSIRAAHFASSAIFIGALAADPSFRKNARESKNKDGDVIGYSATFRKERSVTARGATRIAQLETQLAAAMAKLNTLTALPA
jgi:hypothetical protein